MPSVYCVWSNHPSEPLRAFIRRNVFSRNVQANKDSILTDAGLLAEICACRFVFRDALGSSAWVPNPRTHDLRELCRISVIAPSESHRHREMTISSPNVMRALNAPFKIAFSCLFSLSKQCFQRDQAVRRMHWEAHERHLPGVPVAGAIGLPAYICRAIFGGCEHVLGPSHSLARKPVA